MKSGAGNTVFSIAVLVAFSSCLWGQGAQGGGEQQPPAKAAVPADAAAPASGVAQSDTFVIGNDDVLAISVWKETDISRSVPVRSDGKISLPLVGEIQAAGLTPRQLELDLTEKLKKYITDPQVTVIVAEIKSRNFNILGRVAKPGSYSLTVAPTVLDAIAAAGGFLDFAKQSSIYVLRPKSGSGKAEKINFDYKDFIKGGKKSQNITLEPHDTSVVP